MHPSLLLSLGRDMLTQSWDLNTGRTHGKRRVCSFKMKLETLQDG